MAMMQWEGVLLISKKAATHEMWIGIWHDEKGRLGLIPFADLAKFMAAVQAENTQRKDGLG